MSKKLSWNFLLLCTMHFALFTSPAYSEEAELKLNSSDGSSAFIVQDAASQTVFKADSDGNVLVKGTMTVQGNAFSVAGSTLVIKGGNVGIGTTGPLAKLHLQTGDGSLNFNGLWIYGDGATLRFANGAQTLERGWMGWDPTDGRFEFQFSPIGNNNVLFNTNGKNLLFDSVGNVGIGTTGPGGKLTVQNGGTYALSNTGALLLLETDDANTNPAKIILSGNKAGVGNTNPALIQVYGQGRTGVSTLASEINFITSQGSSGTNINGNIAF